MTKNGWTVEMGGMVLSTEPTRESAELTAAFAAANYQRTVKVRRYTASGGRTVQSIAPVRKRGNGSRSDRDV